MAKSSTERAWMGKVFKGLITFLSWFSLANQQRIGSALGRVLTWFPNYNREVVRANLKSAYPNLTALEHNNLVLKTLQENVKSFAEIGRAHV